MADHLGAYASFPQYSFIDYSGSVVLQQRLCKWNFLQIYMLQYEDVIHYIACLSIVLVLSKH